ncbi:MULTISPECIES: YeeE/YedE thiosulfate transporter family protein [unclassified Microcoleus]|uniref:YeeE/YedE thiosulfate transporter family protein n=1 Tax=unclassified Microcoleus TaxID=2642155 RepID=UPI002FD16AFA
MICYGSLLAFGCNVGAFFSGIASISAQGWLSIAADEVGSVARIIFAIAPRTPEFKEQNYCLPIDIKYLIV